MTHDDYHVLDAAEKDLADIQLDAPPKPLLPFAIQNLHVRECLSEFLSTFTFCVFGLGVNAQVILSSGAAGNYTNLAIGWGVGVMSAMHIGGGVSHSHLNPAITVSLAVFGVFPWRKVPGYVLSQTLGAFVGSLMIYGMFYQIIHHLDPLQTVKTAAIFHTQPNALVDNSAAFLAEMLAAMVLLIGILALVDEKNRPTVVPNFPSCVAILVVGIGMSFSLISSAALNPARDFGPRVMLAMVGYEGVFSANDSYFWIPIVAPTLGAIIGCALYVLCIMGHHPAKVVQHGFF